MDFLAGNVENLITKVKLLVKLDHREEAIPILLKILEIDPDNTEAITIAGDILVILER